MSSKPRVERPATRSDVGFTLIELLAAVSIIGTLAAIALPKTHELVDRANVAKAIGDIQSIAMDLDTQDTLPDDLTFFGPPRIDPWGNPYQYNKFPPDKKVPQGARRDRFLVPINSNYDLFSMGKDGDSQAPLNAKASRDDIIRANDGGFIGLAEQY